MSVYRDATSAIEAARSRLNNWGVVVDQKHWQSVASPDKTIEILNFNFSIHIPDTVAEMQYDVKPHLPWADRHFAERVGGKPLNPPPSHSIWPFAKKNNSGFVIDEKFSHTYPERFWPKQANKPIQDGESYYPNEGIRYTYGDLRDLVNLLGNDPTTRQAYLPVFFPEDTGTVHKQRVPCTLGYHFYIRAGALNINYYMRSCDIIRHFRDDIYLAMRLARWVADELRDEYKLGYNPGMLSMYITSLHCFANDIAVLKSGKF